MPQQTAWSLKEKILSYLGLITVEPTMVLYMMAFMTTSVVEQAFFIDRACRVNHQFNATICDNINDKKYKNFTKEVQITVSNFHIWNDVAGHSGQIILALFMGAWSDKRGRKLPLLLGLLGKLYYSAMIVVNTVQDTWPVEYIVYTATLPMGFTGADVAIFAAAFTYLVDVSSQQYRTLRVTLLEVCYLATMPTGIALGSYLFREVTNKSYTIMFSINVILMAIAIIYTFVVLKWRTNDRQRPLSEAPNLLLDFFDYNHVIDTTKSLYKKRPRNQRAYLLLLIFMMGLYTFQRDEKNMMYIFVQLAFNWSLGDFSIFKTVQSALQDVVLLTAIPLMSRVFGWRDTIIIMIGAFCHSVARIFYVNAEVAWVFYAGGVFAAFGPIVAPVIRSMVSKLVAPTEKGKTFSVLSVADNAIPLVSSMCYSLLYNATIHDFPASIFYLTMGTQVAVFMMITYIHFKTKDEGLVYEDEEVQSGCLEGKTESGGEDEEHNVL